MDIIIGGGISGLSYALFCQNKDWKLFESEDKLGGYCKTTRRNGFVWDYSGHFFHFQDEELRNLLMQRLIDQRVVVEVDKSTFIKYKKLLVDYPFQKNIHQLDKDEFIDCLVDLFDTHEQNFNSFKEMLYCKFGKGISEKFLIPYNEKLYACDINILDKDAMGRFFPYANKEQIIQNFRKQDNNTYNGSFVYPKGGAIEYVNQLASRLDNNKIFLNHKVIQIIPELKEIILDNGEHLKYDRLISTIPFPHLLDISGIEYDRNIYSWNKVLVFNIGFDRKGPIKKTHWIYFPEDKYCFYRVGFYDNIIDQDRTSVYIEIGFDKNASINPKDYLERVLLDLKEANMISSKQIMIDYEAIIMDPAYVHITEKSKTDVNDKKKILAEYQIYSIGRYGSWTYCSIEDNIKEARHLAKKIM